MKRSERLIRNTILVLVGLIVLYVGVSRLYADSRSAHVTLRNNGVQQWHIVASEAAELRVDKASMSAAKVDLAGHVTLTVID